MLTFENSRLAVRLQMSPLRPVTAESLFSPQPAKSMSPPQKREKTPQKREKASLESPTDRQRRHRPPSGEVTTTQAVIISNSQVLRRARLRRCGLLRHLIGEGRLSHAAAAVTECAWPCAF